MAIICVTIDGNVNVKYEQTLIHHVSHNVELFEVLWVELLFFLFSPDIFHFHDGYM